jgi:hypothetical protein
MVQACVISQSGVQGVGSGCVNVKRKESNMKYTEELIEKMKNNWTAWGGLSEEERGVMRKYSDDIVYHHQTGWMSNPVTWGDGRVLRLSPKFKLKEPASEWVEYPVKDCSGTYHCYVDHKRTNYLLSRLPDLVGFAGVQFEGGGETFWMCVCQSGGSNENKPATPIKARFYVGRGEKI